MLGGFAGVVLMEHLGLMPLLAVPIAVVLIGAVCAILQQAFVRPLMARPGADFGTVAVTLGLSVTLQNAAFHVWGERFQVLPYYVEGVVEVGGLFLPAQRLLILVAAVMALGGLAVMLQTTRFGRAVRATAQDGEAARVLGVPVERIHMAVFALAGGLGALAACLLAPLTAVNPWMGAPLMLKAFVVVVLGGLTSMTGAIAAAFLIGIIENVGVTFTSSEWRDVIAFAFLVVCIWARPWGLFGQAAR